MTPRLFAIVPAAGAVDPDVVDEWIELGARRCGIALLLREPGGVPARLLDPQGRLAGVRARARDRGVAIVLGCAGEDVGEAIAAVDGEGLAGVQVRGDPDAMVLARARDGLGARLLGRSCHGVAAGGHALVDYTMVAPVKETASHPGAAVIGMAGLSGWCREPGARIVALGGIGAADAAACVGAGAWGVAGISAFFGPERARAVAAFVAALAGAG